MKLPFVSSVTRGCCASLLSLGAAQAADVLEVGQGGGVNYNTIQAAVDAAGDGDVILVRAATYTEEVTITARSLTIVASGLVTIAGHVFVRDLAQGQVLLLSGLRVEPPQAGVLGHTQGFFGALDARSCDGLIRLQDCHLRGAKWEWHSPFGGQFATFGGGPGALLMDCADAALVDCRADGGHGAPDMWLVGGAGGPGLWATDVARLAFVRSVATGGRGGHSDNPGSGGSGLVIAGTTVLNIAYSALFGGEGGEYSGFFGIPGWTTSGGDGLQRGVGTVTWDFAGSFAGGEVSPFVPPQGVQINGSPHSGPGSMQTIPGFPNALSAPALVHEGNGWALEFFAEVGETVRLFHASQTTFDFILALEQPRLIGGVDVRRYPLTTQVPASQQVQLSFPPLALPPSVDAHVHWFQGFVTAPAGGSAFSSPRAIIFLNAGF